MEYKQYEGVSPAAMDGSDWDNYTEGRGTERLN